MLRLFYLLFVIVCVVPTLPGLLGVTVAAFGYVPPVGLTQFSWFGFQAVAQWHGVGQSIGLTIFSTLASTYLACFLCFMILQAAWTSRYWTSIERCLSPLLAMPHVAFAIGFAFLFDPTGLGARVLHALFSQGLGYTPSEMSWFVNDAHALGLVIMLTLKELPFLLLMSIPLLKQIPIEKMHKAGASLGYQPSQFWWKCILPQWLVKLRFALFAVLAYGVSVVDVAQILGPTNPPTFAVLVWQWFKEPDLSLLPRAAAGAVILFVLATVLLGFALLIERGITQGWRQWQYSGRFAIALPGISLFGVLLAFTLGLLPLLGIWSIAQRWRFPDLLPSQYSLRFWLQEWQGLSAALQPTLIIGLISATLALLLAILAHEYRLRNRLAVPSYLLVLPMLLPQLSILFGLQVMTLIIDQGSYGFWVCWSHLFFVFPLVYLALDGPWRSFNPNFTRVALSLGKSPWQAWVQVKLPILFPAIAFAWAVGLSASFAQYLPTLILGAGRITTLTTEAVALSSGFDRRVTAIYALWQALLPWLFFSLAMLLGTVPRRLKHKLTFPKFALVSPFRLQWKWQLSNQ
ncbi:ABC transporter permease [Vibrio metoecus]|uniref:Thiamine ABC transporter permease n=1 Tax=Vibrio metoecus TaxID=1481663 RepID=A0ABR4S092_VIBMT|nr:thiamine ABC transporter permease [Vibrio metoecus]KDO15396.1 thiamine ABC transporter permease [Vibrio metoecus]PAR27554.1 thiamine ABC transporter permease [Vibrio metoecus]PAR60845.1 thiamine ABC transporter permease [Vibrio metoecus]